MTIGDQKITAAQWDQIVNGLPAQYQKAARGPQKRQIADQLVQLKVLSAEAAKRGVDKQPQLRLNWLSTAKISWPALSTRIW